LTRSGPSPGLEPGLPVTHHVDYTSLAHVPETGMVDERVQRKAGRHTRGEGEAVRSSLRHNVGASNSDQYSSLRA